MSSIHIHHVTALTMHEEALLINDAALVITGERLNYVGPTAHAPMIAADDIYIDGQGMVAMPGLINAHTHLAMTLFRGAADDLPLMTWLQEKIWPVEARLTSDDVYWASLLGIAEMLRAGITTFCDMYWHVEAVADAVRESGIRACLSGVVIGNMPNSAAILDSAIQRVRNFRSEAHPRITPFFGPHAPYTVPDAMLKTIIAEAQNLNVAIHTHLAETTAEVASCHAEFHCSPIARMQQVGLFSVPVIAAHCVHPDENDFDVLAENKVSVAHCPSSNMKLGSGIAPITRYLKNGVTVALGSDGAGSNNTLDILREMHTAALLHKVAGDSTAVNALQALQLATYAGANALRLPELGYLSAGKLADVILVDFQQPHLKPKDRIISNLVYAAGAGDVDTVIVHGKILLRKRQLTTLDLTTIYAHVEESVTRLFT